LNVVIYVQCIENKLKDSIEGKHPKPTKKRPVLLYRNMY
jgi:hypothetical protein